jgi:L-iditol 2-dehydrogenase
VARRVEAAVYLGRERVEPAWVEIRDPGVGEVRLDVEACGICGSDLHVYHGGGRTAPGMTLGHEISGIVESVGADVHGWARGDRVTVEPLLTCGECELCRTGLDNLCPHYRLIGLDVPGGLAPQVVVPAKRLYPVPAGMDPRLAALSEPVAVVVHALRLAPLEAGQDVLVLGAGTIGLLSVALARLQGAGRILVTARHAHQATLARELGADEVFGADEVSDDVLPPTLAAHPPPLVIETVGGRAQTLQAATTAIAPGGTILVLGVFSENVCLTPFPLLLKEITLRWSICYSRERETSDFDEALQLLATHGDLLGRVLTHTRALAEVGDAFALAADKTSGAVKVSVVP